MITPRGGSGLETSEDYVFWNRDVIPLPRGLNTRLPCLTSYVCDVGRGAGAVEKKKEKNKMDGSIIRNNENSNLRASHRDKYVKVRPLRMRCPSPPESRRWRANKQEKTNHRHRPLTANGQICMCASIETIKTRISAEEERKICERGELPFPLYAHRPSGSVR